MKVLVLLQFLIVLSSSAYASCKLYLADYDYADLTPEQISIIEAKDYVIKVTDYRGSVTRIANTGDFSMVISAFPVGSKHVTLEVWQVYLQRDGQKDVKNVFRLSENLNNEDPQTFFTNTLLKIPTCSKLKKLAEAKPNYF